MCCSHSIAVAAAEMSLRRPLGKGWATQGRWSRKRGSKGEGAGSSAGDWRRRAAAVREDTDWTWAERKWEGLRQRKEPYLD